MKTKPIVMLVDDQPNIIKLILEDRFDLLIAENGQQALDILELVFTQQKNETNNDDNNYGLPHVIVSDVMMPVMDGYQLYEQVRANPYLNHIPFIFLTSKDEPADIRHGKIVGADDYLPKPCPREDLIASINGKLRRSKQTRTLQKQLMGNFGSPYIAGIIMLIAFIAIMGLTIVITVLTTLYFMG